MQFESALELKGEILRRIRGQASALVDTGPALEALRDSFRPGLAIGISRRGGRDFRLALRVQARGLGTIVDQVRRWASNEVDVR